MTASPSLAERLGHKPDAKLLIVNCDDLGSSHSANRAIEASLRKGFGSSATLMVPCPWAREAAERCKDLDIGVHLTLTAEYPGYRWRSLTGAKSLHDADGFLPATTAEVFGKADPGDVERECRAQVEQALQWGVDVTHLDAHMGTMQTDPRYFAIYVKLAAKFRLPLRMVGQSQDERLGFDCRGTSTREGIVFPDRFISPWPRMTREVFRESLPHLKPGVTEIYLHPVEDGPELRGYDPTHPHLRADDSTCLFDPELKGMIEENSIELISFRPLRELQRSNSHQ
jgi:predicted glycoside hydrolase/deacetylase ChbG (UPF0249 family)